MENVKNDTKDRELIITRKINAPVELVCLALVLALLALACRIASIW